MRIFHNSQKTEYRSPFGAVHPGETVLLACDANLPEGAGLCLRVEAEGTVTRLEPDRKVGARYGFTLSVPQTPGLVYYTFETSENGSPVYYGTREDGFGGEGELCKTPRGYQITVYHTEPVPEWMRDGVMYQIYTDRFARGGIDRTRFLAPGSLVHAQWDDTPFYIREADNSIRRWDFFGGTLEGITEKLDLLAERGVTVLYLNPIFEAPSNHKYDTADYRKVDEGYGTREDLIRLVTEAHDRGMRVLLDGVFSHTGSDSLYFNAEGRYPEVGAAQSPDSPFASWYRFMHWPDRYDCWWGVLNMPCVEETDESYLRYMLRDDDSTVRQWMRCGIDGWRLDVADELPDSFLKEMHRVVREENPDAVLLGEVWEDASRKVSYNELRTYFTLPELDSVTDYPFRDAVTGFLLGKLTSGEAGRSLMGLCENYPRPMFESLMNMTGTHDTLRLMTLLGEAPEASELSEAGKERYRLPEEQYELAKARVKLFAMLQFTFPGMPCVYYGDEAGMQGYTDPFNRGPYPWGHEDEELVAWFTGLAKLRKRFPALTRGEWSCLSPAPDVLGWLRRGDGEAVVTLANRSGEDRCVPFPAGEAPLVLMGEGKVREWDGGFYAVLPPRSGMILWLSEERQ